MVAQVTGIHPIHGTGRGMDNRPTQVAWIHPTQGKGGGMDNRPAQVTGIHPTQGTGCGMDNRPTHVATDTWPSQVAEMHRSQDIMDTMPGCVECSFTRPAQITQTLLPGHRKWHRH
jgi:hypothetical protein